MDDLDLIRSFRGHYGVTKYGQLLNCNNVLGYTSFVDFVISNPTNKINQINLLTINNSQSYNNVELLVPDIVFGRLTPYKAYLPLPMKKLDIKDNIQITIYLNYTKWSYNIHTR